MLKRYKEGQKNMLDTLLSNTAFTVTKNPILNDKLKSQYLQLVLELWPSKAQPSFSHSHPESNHTPKRGMKRREKKVHSNFHVCKIYEHFSDWQIQIMLPGCTILNISIIVH